MKPPQNLPLRIFNLLTLTFILLLGLMIAVWPQRAFAQKDMGQGYCSLHGNYVGASCPRCAAAASGGTTGGNSASDQVILDAAGQVGTVIGSELHKALFGDPAAEQAAAQAQALAQQRAAEAAAEAEQKKQADYTRLHGLLKLDNFDGDSGGVLLLKGVDVESGDSLARDAGGKLALKLGDDDLQPQTTRAAANNGAADPPAPNTDPMIVDLRGTTKTFVDPALFKNDSSAMPPEQLPKGIDDALLAAYADAPPGVSDRVHKGFLAIAEHDWIIALASFQDALNKNPDDPGLKRLVNLAQFTLDYRMRLPTPAVANNSASVQATPSSEQTLTIKSTDDAEVKAAELYSFTQRFPATAAQMSRSPEEQIAVAARAEAACEQYNKKSGEHDFLARAAAGQMAARARYSAAFEQYAKEHGDHVDYLARAKATNQAYRGEGYSKKELDAQFQKALLDYYIVTDGRKQSGSVGGSAVVEDIILGGKG